MSKLQKGFSNLMVFIMIGVIVAVAIYIANKLGFTGDFRGRADNPLTQIYWGSSIKGNTYSSTSGDAPWDLATWDTFEAHAGKKVSILHWGQGWYWTGHNGHQPFYSGDLQKARDRGAIPLVDWGSWDLAAGGTPDQPNFQLQDIINGNYDNYITSWATSAKNWRHPFFLRFNSEMNGTWWPWSESRNGNNSGEFVLAWRHVHDIFQNVGATNVTWVWCPNILYPSGAALEGLYPGDAYVDWTCMDGYNWGQNPAKPDSWKGFYTIFKPTYDKLLSIAPNKPIMIGETSSTEYFTTTITSGHKGSWITDALGTQLPLNFPKVKALVWFNHNADGMDWVIETSQESQTAFAGGIASNYYATNTFGALTDLIKIQPLTTLVSTPPPIIIPSLTPTPTSVPTITPSPSPSASSAPLSATISFTAPLNGSRVARKSQVNITAMVTSNIEISKVEFYINDNLTCTDTNSSYSCSWNVPAKPNSTYRLTAKAYDASNNFSSHTITVTSDK